jgi:hypothetical protein
MATEVYKVKDFKVAMDGVDVSEILTDPTMSAPVMKPPKVFDEHRYLIDPSRCPICGEQQIEGRDTDYLMAAMTQEMSCLMCGAQWQDVYKLTRAVPYDDEDVIVKEGSMPVGRKFGVRTKPSEALQEY